MSRQLCPYCGVQMPGEPHYESCPMLALSKKISKKPGRIELHQKRDGDTWMVSVITPDTEFGSAYFSERAGNSPHQAAESYMAYDDDNAGADLVRKNPHESFICVIDIQMMFGRACRVHLFMLEGDEVKRFP